jgi:hypothetical protein
MRLSAWRTVAPTRESLAPPVRAVVDPVVTALGADPDPWAWIAWGDEPAVRFTILAPVPAGLIVAIVRVNVPGEGPRVSAKLVRWPRVQVGDLSIETSAGHRLLSIQVEGIVLKGVDDEATRIAQFVQVVFAGADNRPWPSLEDPAPAARRSGGNASAAKKVAAPRGRPSH